MNTHASSVVKTSFSVAASLLLSKYGAFSLYTSWSDLCHLALAPGLCHVHLPGWIDVG